jgi:hypothetical protein
MFLPTRFFEVHYLYRNAIGKSMSVTADEEENLPAI